MSQEAPEESILKSKEVHSNVLCENCNKRYGLHYGSRCQPDSDSRWQPAVACSVDAAAAPSPSQNISGVPNCQQFGPHLCPEHDGLRWAQQDELNLANLRVIEEFRRQIANVSSNQNWLEARPKAETALLDRHEKLITDLRDKVADLRDAVIGSDVPAAAPSSPNYNDVLQRTHNLAARLTAWEHWHTATAEAEVKTYAQLSNRLTALEAQQQQTAAALTAANLGTPKSPSGGAWIPCSRHLPPADVSVIAWTPSRPYRAHIANHRWVGANNLDLDRVEYWCYEPVPQPPL